MTVERDESFDFSQYEVSFGFHGNFTICSIEGPSGEVVALGASKRAEADSDYEEAGKNIAFSRAVKNGDFSVRVKEVRNTLESLPNSI